MNQIVLVLKFLNKKEIFDKGKLYYNIEFAPIQKQIYVLEMFNKLNTFIKFIALTTSNRSSISEASLFYTKF